MTAYCIFDIRHVHDEPAMAEYRERVVPVVESFGGEYVVIGGPWQVVEGAWRPSFPVVITFPDIDAANAWYRSAEYRALRELRIGAADTDAVFLEGLLGARTPTDEHAAVVR